jgi:hypothetical protein
MVFTSPDSGILRIATQLTAPDHPGEKRKFSPFSFIEILVVGLVVRVR